ncbi:erythromycin esterase family protein [Glycomyces sp. TRM65418]|uniref:erythromycin esterase family protein n=1 Tax=Glycomyces sp. TRM65418 TaxID=2867006 RepID=UPI001CE4DAD4|nr:erythromycin esterase family protein [Glycomyces sp. TRM65418]MCC3764815.1 erythromycin esterase family protein [Glycomyces sp. TRM65418]QZD54466.1 erythromycin esterase family protein [Glycomyces sp. TRM65418]
MTQDIRDFVNDSCELLALGEPDHREPAFGRIRNELFAQLVDRGFRSIALETDRVAALAANDYVQHGTGTLDAVMRDGFTHGFGEFDANRRLIEWMREYNERQAPEDRLAFYGTDGPFEFTAPSPRRYLETVRDYLGLDIDLTPLVGDDDRWESDEAVMDPAASPGDTAEADRLRVIADDLSSQLYAAAPDLIAATSRDAWDRAKAHAATALGLLRYHRQAAERIGDGDRWSRLSGVRDALMAQQLLDIRDIEARRGPTMVHGHNAHLQRSPSRMSMAGMDLAWNGTGAIVSTLMKDRYLCIVGWLGRSEGTGPESPDSAATPGQYRWSLAEADMVDLEPMSHEQGRVPLDRDAVESADAVLCVSG